MLSTAVRVRVRDLWRFSRQAVYEDCFPISEDNMNLNFPSTHPGSSTGHYGFLILKPGELLYALKRFLNTENLAVCKVVI